METIKFSHKYMKMPSGYDKSRVLDVWVIDDISMLSKEFIEADTLIDSPEGDHYKLPNTGKFMMVVLGTESGKMWTTIRSYNDEKFKWYKGLIGKPVNIFITTNKKTKTQKNCG